MSVAKASYCEMGERCKLYDRKTKKSQKLGRYHKRTICDRCWNVGYRPEDALTISGDQVGAGHSSPNESVVCSQCGNEAVEVVIDVFIALRTSRVGSSRKFLCTAFSEVVSSAYASITGRQRFG